MGIYDSLGGAPAVAATVEEFYQRVTADPSLAPFFDGVDMPKVKGHLRSFLTAVLGGPQLFAGRDMVTAHAALHIGDEDFDAVLAHLVDTLTSLGVHDALIGEIGSVLLPLRAAVVTQQRRRAS